MIEKGAEEEGEKQASPFDRFKVGKLKQMLHEADLPVSGTKDVLIECLTASNVVLSISSR